MLWIVGKGLSLGKFDDCFALVVMELVNVFIVDDGFLFFMGKSHYKIIKERLEERLSTLIDFDKCKNDEGIYVPFEPGKIIRNNGNIRVFPSEIDFVHCKAGKETREMYYKWKSEQISRLEEIRKSISFLGFDAARDENSKRMIYEFEIGAMKTIRDIKGEMNHVKEVKLYDRVAIGFVSYSVR